MKRVLWSGTALVLLLTALVLPAAQTDRKKAAEANLRSVTERLERLQRQTQQDAVEKDLRSRDLRAAERSVAKAQGELSSLRSQRAERLAARKALADERAEREADKQRAEDDLAAQLRTAYFMGRNEPLKLLLNQRSPAQFGRNLTYYGYLGRLRASQINLIAENIDQIDDLTAKIDEEDARLAELEGKQKERVAEWESARRQRARVLVSLERDSRNRAATMARLQTQQQQFERLLKELSRQTDAVPFDPNDPFARLRGKLSWPVSGRVGVSFGDAVAGNLRSDGIEIDTDRGNNVRAVHDGLVVYSDWLQGRGLLIVLRHSNGYMSVYGHNEQLFKPVGARVEAGDTIATAGDSGGRKKPGLYFQIRRSGKPVDPRGWFRTSAPPAG